MGGSLLQLVAKGVHDLYLINDPQITMFKSVYRRCSNFSMFDEILFSKSGGNFSSKMTFNIERKADLLHKLYLVVNLPEIFIKKHAPTFQYIANLLASFGVTWDYSPNDDEDMVTLEVYNTNALTTNSIITQINNQITTLINNYNFFINGTILSSSVSSIKSDTFNFFNYLADGSDADLVNTKIALQNSLTNGRSLSMDLFYNMLQKYMTLYSSVYPFSNDFLPDNDVYVIPINASGSMTVNKMLYDTSFKNTIFNNSLLIGSLLAYGFDTLIYNTATDTATNTIDSAISSPLFGSILNRGSSSKSTIIPFSLYTSDDIRYLHYLSFLNNMISIELTTGAVTFNPINAVILNNASTNVSNLYLSDLLPSQIPLNESILFYHTLDSDIVNYVVTKSDIGKNTDIYFSSNIKPVYDIIEQYKSLIATTYGSYTDTDAYKIYKSYIEFIKNFNNMNSTITSLEQTKLLASAIKYNINNNMIYNFNQLSNVMTILYYGQRNQLSSYVLSFYKSYTYSSSTNLYNMTDKLSFTPIINNAITNLADNFVSVLNNVPSLSSPTNITVKKFFNDAVKSGISNLLVSCQDQLKSTNYDPYVNDYQLWNKILFTTGSNILDTYTGVATNATYFTPSAPIPDSSVFDQIAFMNFIPFASAKDIPRMMYDIFNSYAKHIFVNLGIDLLNVPTNFDLFMDEIDYRDTNDGGTTTPAKETTKNTIYARVISTIFVNTMNDSSYRVVNDAYFDALRDNYAQGTTYLLTCSLRPESFLPEYSTINTTTGVLTDVVGDSVYLTMDWLTQTYYQIFNTVMTDFINGLVVSGTIKTQAITILQGFIQNVVNCFIAHSNMPTFDSYKNNGHMLLNLITETSSTVSQYQQYNSSIATTPLYCDAISSIWYQTQKHFFQMFNKLFNDLLFSETYYPNNLGNSMGSLFDYIQAIIESVPNDYYTQLAPYPIRTPDTISATSSLTEIYPAIVSADGNNGFDIVRLSSLGNPSSSGDDAYHISTYLQDFTSLFTFSMNYYNAHKSMLFLKYDAGWLYTIASDTSQLTLTPKFFFDRSADINTFLNNHEKNKYIIAPLSSTIQADLTTLANNTQIYWDPATSPTTGVYGILDAIYNSSLTGNIITTIQNINVIPGGQIASDYINNQYNPFTSYCLHYWYLTIAGEQLSPLNIFQYSDLQTAWATLDNILGTSGSPNITSSILAQNKNLLKLYSNYSSSLKPFPDASYITWYVIDRVLETITSTGISFVNMLQLIDNTSQLNDNGATDTIVKFNNYFKDQYGINLNSYKIISNIINTSIYANKISIQINGFDQFIDLNPDTSVNDDILFYEESLNGAHVINTNLEIILLDLINAEPSNFAWVRELGHKIIKNVSISIGGQMIDSHSSELLHLIYKTSKDENQERGYNIMIGNTQEMYNLSTSQRLHNTLYIPLRFWFCKNMGNSLPLINMMYSEITINIELNDLNKLLYIDEYSYFTKQPKLTAQLLAQYIYVDEDERKRIGGSKLEYLIEKYNYNGKDTFTANNLKEIAISDGSTSSTINPIAKIDLRLEDPTKYLMWYFKFNDKTTEQKIDIINWAKNGYNVRDSDGDIITIKPIVSWMELHMMGVTREHARSETYFTNTMSYGKMMPSLERGEYIYSFALYPLIHQPSGSANLTEIGKSDITFQLTDQTVAQFQNNKNLELTCELWGCTINILRVMSGCVGLAFYK